VVTQQLKHRITFSLDQSSFKNLSRVARENNVSTAWVIRYAVDNFLRERKEGQHQQLILRREGKCDE